MFILGVLVLGLWFWGFTLGADGSSGRPSPTQTGQRSGELTANSDYGRIQKWLFHLACLFLRLHGAKILNIARYASVFCPAHPKEYPAQFGKAIFGFFLGISG